MAGERGSAADAVIVGGGFSGTMVAAQLARRGRSSILIEKAVRAGEGVAYATRDPMHLLNVPAAKMSAWPDAPDEFAEVVAAAGIGGPGSFAPRMAYGEYLKAVLDEAEASGLVRVIEGEAVAARRGPSNEEKWVVTLDDGEAVSARALVLACGNQPPAPLAFPGAAPDGVVIDDPWSRRGRKAIASLGGTEAGVLIVGTGLTMIDMVVTLDEVGHEGPVTALSRRGLMPRAHVAGVTALPAPGLGEVPDRLSDAVAWLRARGIGVDWRAAVDSLRPVTQALWAGWSEATRERFVRHARPWWDVHRHRIAPEIAEWVKGDIANGKLDLVAGRIAGVESDGEDALVRIARRDGTTGERRVAAIVNCTGPLGRIEATRDRLLAQMLRDELVRADGMGIGLEGDDGDRVAEDAWALGPLTKGRWWEITAVPDIRGQAERVAEAIAANAK